MSSFNFLNVVFNVPNFKKPIFYIIKKYICIANIFASQKKYLFSLFSLFVSLFNVYNNLFWINVRGVGHQNRLLYTLNNETKTTFKNSFSNGVHRLQSMYNHMVGRTASVISPFYSLLPVVNLWDPWDE